MTAAYNDLTTAVENKRRTCLNRYGATNPAEFFAVWLRKLFLSSLDNLKRHDPELFELLRRYYREINPASWKVN